jgi:hypothetical protein
MPESSTPTITQMRDAYAFYRLNVLGWSDLAEREQILLAARADFDRALAAHDAETAEPSGWQAGARLGTADMSLRILLPPTTVALLKLPVSIAPLAETTSALRKAYGDDIVIRTDTGISGWMVLATDTSSEVAS